MRPNKEARSYAYELVSDDKADISKLDQDEKEMLAALLIESNNKFQAWEYISEPSESLDLPFLLANYMKTRSPEDAQEVLESLVNGAVKYAGNEMVDVLLDQDKEYQADKEYYFDE